jgi:dihydrofolate reductase
MGFQPVSVITLCSRACSLATASDCLERRRSMRAKYRLEAYATLQHLQSRHMKAIVAMTRKRVIGESNKIPWRLRGEQSWFKEVTMGHPILMGRKTFESIGMPLPGRRNLVVTRTGNFAGVDLIRDLKAFDPAPYEVHGKEIFVIGGAEIYRALLDRCDTIYVTIVKEEYAGDAYFPEFESQFAISGTIRQTPAFDIFCYRRRR